MNAYPKPAPRKKKSPSIPPAMKAAVLERDNYLCVIASRFCTRVATDADHRVGRGNGGSRALNSPEVLVAACRSCNHHKETDLIVIRDTILRGINIPRSQSSQRDLARCRETPVTFPDGSRWLLDAHGNRTPFRGDFNTERSD